MSVRFGPRTAMAIVALSAVAYFAYERAMARGARTCALNRAALEVGMAVYRTSNTDWGREEPYTLTFHADGMERIGRFEPGPPGEFGRSYRIANVVRDVSLFRCPSAPAGASSYRAVIKLNAHRASVFHVQCLVDASHADPELARFFTDRGWMPEADRAERGKHVGL